MIFAPPLLTGRLIKRYKRFFADVLLDNGEQIVAHCPNTGSMRHCLVDNSPCWVSPANNPKRKLAYTLEAVTTSCGAMAGINTHRANNLIFEAMQQDQIAELGGYGKIRKEVTFQKKTADSSANKNDPKTRFDFYLEHSADQQANCFVEVKNVTLGNVPNQGTSTTAMFPDSVSVRATKHAQELIVAKQLGYRAVLLFCVQHSTAERVTVAKEFDPVYAEALKTAIEKGVEVLCYQIHMNPKQFKLSVQLPFFID